MLQLKQGDIVKITWGSPAAVDTLALFPREHSIRTTPTVVSTHRTGPHWAHSPVLTDTNADPTPTKLSQTVVTASGNYPLLFLDTKGVGNAGPYSFTAVVLHAAAVSFTHQSQIPGAGIFKAAVLAPDGSSINDSTLKLTLNGYWGNRKHKLATASPTNGIATFDYSLPWSVWGKKSGWTFPAAARAIRR